VLIADDDPDVHALLSVRLGALGYDVQSAFDVEQACLPRRPARGDRI